MFTHYHELKLSRKIRWNLLSALRLNFSKNFLQPSHSWWNFRLQKLKKKSYHCNIVKIKKTLNYSRGNKEICNFSRNKKCLLHVSFRSVNCHVVFAPHPHLPRHVLKGMIRHWTDGRENIRGLFNEPFYTRVVTKNFARKASKKNFVKTTAKIFRQFFFRSCKNFWGKNCWNVRIHLANGAI